MLALVDGNGWAELAIAVVSAILGWFARHFTNTTKE